MDIAPTYPHAETRVTTGLRFTMGRIEGAVAQMMELGRVLVQPIDLESIGFITNSISNITITNDLDDMVSYHGIYIWYR